MKTWWQRRTLRFRLAAWYGIGGAFLLSLFSATVYGYVRYTMAQPLDYELRRDLENVRENLKILPGGRVLWQGKDFPSGEPWPPQNPWFELWDQEGHLVRRYWPFVDARLEHLPVPPAPGRETLSVFRVSPDIRLRVLSVPLEYPVGSEKWMIRVMTIHEPATNAMRSLLLIIAVALPVVILLLVAGGYAITRRWLTPLGSMVREVHQITANDLSRRVRIQNKYDEIGMLAEVFNSTLARLEDSFLTLDRFVADASHELLTPLTILRSVGEVGLRGTRSPEDLREIIGSMLEEAQRLQLLVEKLLQLARAEGGAAMVERSAVRIDLLAQECVEDASVLAEDKGQQVVLNSVLCETYTDELLFRQALQNLLENAIKYSPADTTITVSVAKTDSDFEVAVTDQGPGIPAEDRVRIMDRFFRADRSRDRNAGGFGLGLAITKAYMRVLGGELIHDPGENGGSTFRLRQPLLKEKPATALGSPLAKIIDR